MGLGAGVEHGVVKGRGPGHPSVSNGVVLVSGGVLKGTIEVGCDVKVDASEAARRECERM